MTSDEIFVADDDEEAPEIPEATQTATDFELDGILDELLRSQSKKKLEIAGEIEEQVEALVEGFGGKFKTFLATDCDLKFSGTSIVQSLPVPGLDMPDYILGLCRSGEIPVACFQFENAVAQNLLAVALAGKTANNGSDAQLSASESRLVMVLVDLLASTFFQANEKLAMMEELTPGTRMNRETFEGMVQSDDWVKFDFSLAFADTTEQVTLMSPLALFNGQGLVAEEDDDEEEEVIVDTDWQKFMFDNIENLKIPINLELGSIEIPLAQIECLEPGQTLGIEINANRLRLSTDHGQSLAWAGLLVNEGTMELKILEAAERGQS